jgi:hypothetical protein
MKRKIYVIAFAVLVVLLFSQSVAAANLCGEEWIHQFGDAYWDWATGVALGPNNEVVIVGSIDEVPGIANNGYGVFVKKCDSVGNEIWTRQLGTQSQPHGVAVGAQGDIYIVGRIDYAEFPGQTSYGGVDAFLAKYDTDGEEKWICQFGSFQPGYYTPGDQAVDIVVGPAESIYIVGITEGILPGQTSLGGNDAFIMKYTTEGDVVWTRQFGTSFHDAADGVSVDSLGDIYVVGITSGGEYEGQTNMGGADAYVRKYDSDGNEIWTRQFGTADYDVCSSVSVNLYDDLFVSGTTSGTLLGQSSQGNYDAYLRKYDSDGNEIWTRQFGSSKNENLQDVSTGPLGEPYVAGATYGVLPGQSSYGQKDAFIRKYDLSGNEMWTCQFGTPELDDVMDCAVSSQNEPFVAGYTYGTFPGQVYAGFSDAFIIKFSSEGPIMPVPELPGGLLLFIGIIGLFVFIKVRTIRLVPRENKNEI